MGTKPTFSIVDVFAERAFAGNQLAVVRGVESWSTDTMQAFAREMNYSETTFVVREDAGQSTYDVRIFTPSEELPFAGHPTLGTAWALREARGARDGVDRAGAVANENRPAADVASEKSASADRVVLNLGVGPVPVEFEEEADGRVRGWLTPPEPEFAESVAPELAASWVGLEPDQIDGRFPLLSMSVGIGFVMVPLVDAAALDAASLDAVLWAKRGAALGEGDSAPTGVLLFCRETREAGHDVAARMFFDAAGPREDPATGSANSCLAAYLARYRYLGSADVNAQVEQGYAMGRPSVLFLKASDDGASCKVRVGGHVVLTASGSVEA